MVSMLLPGLLLLNIQPTIKLMILHVNHAKRFKAIKTKIIAYFIIIIFYCMRIGLNKIVQQNILNKCGNIVLYMKLRK